jgi:hypothetical protein
MDRRRIFASVAVLAAIAAGAASANIEALPGSTDSAVGMPAGWRIRDFNAESNYHTLTISHQLGGLGSDWIEYSIDVLGNSSGPTRPNYIIFAQYRGSCRSVEAADVGNPPPAERGPLTRALLARALMALEADCIRPAQRAALLTGFDAAYAALLARYERLRPEVDAADNAMTDAQREAARAERDETDESLNNMGAMNMSSPFSE